MRVEHSTSPGNAICIADLATALLAADVAGRLDGSVVLISEADAGVYAGGGWWRSLTDQVTAAHPDLDITAILDCGDHVGAALSAIRAGCRDLIVADPPVALIGFAAANDVTLHDLPSSILKLGRLDARTGAVIQRFLESSLKVS